MRPPRPWSLLPLLATLWLAACGARPTPAATPATTQTTELLFMPPAPDIDPAALVVQVPRDRIRAIDDPQFEPASAAEAVMRPDERVVGLVLNGDARAYPINILSAHEVVNDVVGGEPVAVTWCPLCYTALVFSRQVDGHAAPLTFGVSGQLLYETLVLYDRETDTLWSQLYAGAVRGPLRGARLGVYPGVHTTWSAWSAEHPASQVLSKAATCRQMQCNGRDGGVAGAYAFDSYAPYYNSPEAGVVDGQMPRDQAGGAAKDRLLGVRVGDAARAYPFAALRALPVVNDRLGGAPILIWFDPASQTGAAYARTVDGRVLTFVADPASPGYVRDQETGSRWQMTTGTAIDGPLRGASLRPVVHTLAFSFGWFDYFPGSDTFTPPA